MTRARTRSFWRLWMPPAIYAAAIFTLSSISYPPAPPGQITDKHLHALVYGGLALLILRAVAAADLRQVTLARALCAAAVAAAYGVTDEFHQWFVPGRSVEGLDVVADAVGAAAAALLAWAAARAWTRDVRAAEQITEGR